jgi:signal transduction histidine kinase
MMLVGQTVVLLGLLLIPLLFMAWRVSRPLSRLAQAARSVRPASEQPPLPETGPSDVRELTRAFNTMRERIVAMLSEKDRMLGAIGHDLRTPLASLRLRVEQVDNDRLRDAMIASIENMAAMLEDILALARTGQPRETPENTDVVALVRELVDEYTALDRPVLLMVEDGLRDHRDIRPIGLQRALRNLIDNAVAYAGAARVAVGKDRDGLKIRVEDDGPGIPEGQIDTIMEPFTRLEESRNRNTGGSGLGLALARAAVQAEGGQIILTNRVPRGLTAMIQLPSHT